VSASVEDIDAGQFIPHVFVQYIGKPQDTEMVKQQLIQHCQNWINGSFAWQTDVDFARKDFNDLTEGQYFSGEILQKKLAPGIEGLKEAHRWHNAERERYNGDFLLYLKIKNIPTDYIKFSDYLKNTDEFLVVECTEIEI